jgi:hypothetical protein
MYMYTYESHGTWYPIKPRHITLWGPTLFYVLINKSLIKFIKMKEINSTLNEYACALNLSLNLYSVSMLPFITVKGSYKFIILTFSAAREEYYKFQDQISLVFLHLERSWHIQCCTHLATSSGSMKFSICLFLLFLNNYRTVTACTTGCASWSTSLLRESWYKIHQGCLQSSTIILCHNLGGLNGMYISQKTGIHSWSCCNWKHMPW